MACWFAPALAQRVLPWSLPPLHARCLAVMHLALAWPLWAAWAQADAAAARIALAGAAAWGGASLLGVVGVSMPPSRALWAWALGSGALGAAALGLLWFERELQAPAEQPDRAWQAAALVGLALAAALALAPVAVASLWPWPLSPALAAAYTGPFAAFGMSAWLVASERRRYARRAPMQALAGMAAGMLVTGTWHVAAFDAARALTWLWFGAFTALLVLACLRLVKR